jgi:hypothetical protein
MDARFRELIDSLEPQFRRLVAMTPMKYGSLPRQIPTRGIYLFSDGQRHLYVGRTNRLRQRLQNHCRPSGTHLGIAVVWGDESIEQRRARAGLQKPSAQPI